MKNVEVRIDTQLINFQKKKFQVLGINMSCLDRAYAVDIVGIQKLFLIPSEPLNLINLLNLLSGRLKQ